jgi:hypothetical protein
MIIIKIIYYALNCIVHVSKQSAEAIILTWQKEEDGKNCTAGSFIICTSYQMLLG